MIESGVHWGHKSNRWDPRMRDYLFAKNQGGVSIIDLRITQTLMTKALEFLYDIAKSGDRILFVGTKDSGSALVEEVAKKTGQYYVSKKWLGGMLTNWHTIRASIKKMEEMEKFLESESLTKKERLIIKRKLDKLNNNLSGVRNMGGVPKVVVVLDTNKEEICIQEAKKIGIPIVAIIDSNSNPDIDYPIPGNDDSESAIRYYFDTISDVILSGMSDVVNKSKKLKATSAEEAFLKEDNEVVQLKVETQEQI